MLFNVSHVAKSGYTLKIPENGDLECNSEVFTIKPHLQDPDNLIPFSPALLISLTGTSLLSRVLTF